MSATDHLELDSNFNSQKLVSLGIAKKLHGINGGLVFELSNLKDSVLEYEKDVYLFPLNSSSKLKVQGEKFKITSINFAHKVIVYLENIDSCEKAKSILPFEIKVLRDRFTKIVDDDQFYTVDLIGMPVYCNQSKKYYGVIKELYFNGSQDVVVIEEENGKLLELPFVDKFFPIVDIASNRVEVILPNYI